MTVSPLSHWVVENTSPSLKFWLVLWLGSTNSEWQQCCVNFQSWTLRNFCLHMQHNLFWKPAWRRGLTPPKPPCCEEAQATETVPMCELCLTVPAELSVQVILTPKKWRNFQIIDVASSWVITAFQSPHFRPRHHRTETWIPTGPCLNSFTHRIHRHNKILVLYHCLGAVCYIPILTRM